MGNETERKEGPAFGKALSWVSVAVALWEMAAPWVLRYSDHRRALYAAIFGGVVILGTSIWAGLSKRPLPNWLDLSRGALLVAAPWVVRYSHVNPARINDTVVGLIIMALAIVELAGKLLPNALDALSHRREQHSSG